VPVARHELVERMRDPVLVFEDSGRLMDHNLCARQLFGVGEQHDADTTLGKISGSNPNPENKGTPYQLIRQSFFAACFLWLYSPLQRTLKQVKKSVTSHRSPRPLMTPDLLRIIFVSIS